MDLKKLIGEMTQARGLPGYEGDVAAIFCREMEKIGLKTDTDAIGNATAYMGKAGGPRIMGHRASGRDRTYRDRDFG